MIKHSKVLTKAHFGVLTKAHLVDGAEVSLCASFGGGAVACVLMSVVIEINQLLLAN